jgi:predicted transcriptional regulator of viral defense system
MSARAYAQLRRLSPTITTAEAAAALGVSTSSASHTLRSLERHGLVSRVRRGTWLVDASLRDPRALASEITRPYPSYVSFESALFAHGVIDQVPRAITLASLGRPRVLRTAMATFVIHRLPPELFGGSVEVDDVRLASAEKALFDFHYVSEASGHPRRRLPEIDLPARFARHEIARWVGRIRDPRLRRRVAARIERAVRR